MVDNLSITMHDGTTIASGSLTTTIRADGTGGPPGMDNDTPAVASVSSPAVAEGGNLDFLVTLSNTSTTPASGTGAAGAVLGTDAASAPTLVFFDGCATFVPTTSYTASLVDAAGNPFTVSAATSVVVQFANGTAETGDYASAAFTVATKRMLILRMKPSPPASSRDAMTARDRRMSCQCDSLTCTMAPALASITSFSVAAFLVSTRDLATSESALAFTFAPMLMASTASMTCTRRPSLQVMNTSRAKLSTSPEMRRQQPSLMNCAKMGN